MKLTSPVFNNNSLFPKKYTCDGDKISPALQFKDVPENAKSLALILDDPDAPSGNFVHLVVWNIPPKTKEIPENTIPGIVGKNSLQENNYVPPCPPSGEHHYIFKLYALDTTLNLDNNKTGKNELEQAMTKHVLAAAELVGLYQR